jgi:hypothetical protein
MKSATTFVPAASVQVPIAEPAKGRRSRHHPRSLAVAYGAFLLFFAFACFIGFAWFTAKLLLTADRTDGILALSLLAGFGIARLLAFLNNRHLSCTLCHGTILHEKRCRKHANANCIPGLSYRAATVASVLCTGNFRCMYCGTPYRLKK